MLRLIKEERLELGDILSAAWDTFQDHFSTILAITLIVFVLFTIVEAFMLPADETVFEEDPSRYLLLGFIASALWMTIFVLGTMAIAYVVERSVHDEKINYEQALRKAFSRWGAVIFAGILASIIILGLALLLIIPGIIAGVYLTFFVYAVVLRDKTGKGALEYSISLVKGQWWRVFWILLCLTIVVGVVSWIVQLLFGLAPDNFLTAIVSQAVSWILHSFYVVAKTIFFLNLDYLKKEAQGDAF
jgi:hypothetical protein